MISARRIGWMVALFLISLPLPALADEVDLPKTGQTTCYDASGDVIDCSDAGQGQDGDLQAGVEWPEPRFTDNSDGTVTDNLTGLIWLKNANCFGQRTWSEALADCNMLASGSCGLTDGSVVGDWRLPNIVELESLVNLEESGPGAWLNSHGFSDVETTVSSYYWSATNSAHFTNLAWRVEMRRGGVSLVNKTHSFNMWPVRGGQNGTANTWRTGQTASYADGDDGALEAGVAWPSPRFTDNGDGTVTDGLTGLIWLKNANCFGQRTWSEALADCNMLASGSCGLTDGSAVGDWRLPNRKELFSLIDFSRELPAIPQGNLFSNVQSSQYLSSTTFVPMKNTSWWVHMASGGTSYGGKYRNDWYVWPVRGGQGGAYCTNDADCDDGLFCNGSESCDQTFHCVAGVSPVLDDGDPCTTDTCDEINDIIVHTPLTDSDGDNVCDAEDAFPGDPSEWEDSDLDNVGNNADLDDDNDGMLDSSEIVLGLDPLSKDNFEGLDLDQDYDIDGMDLSILTQNVISHNLRADFNDDDIVDDKDVGIFAYWFGNGSQIFAHSCIPFDGRWVGVADKSIGSVDGSTCSGSPLIDIMIDSCLISGTALDEYGNEFLVSGNVTYEGGLTAGFAQGSYDYVEYTGSLIDNNVSGAWESTFGCYGTFAICKETDPSCFAINDDDGDGYSEVNGDCDDVLSSVHPNADEICGDGVDQDCNGFDLQCPCADISGAWTVTEVSNATCCQGGNCAPMQGSGVEQVFDVSVIQNGCDFSYEIPGTTYTRTGTIDGNEVEISGVFVIVEGCIEEQNTFTATGTVEGDTINFEGTGIATGTCDGIYSTCTGDSTGTFTR